MNVYLELYQKLLRFAREAQAFQGVYGASLTLAEAHILTELTQKPGITARELIDRIGIDKSSLSRGLANFEQLNFIRSRVSDSDRRARQLFASAKGVRELQRADLRAEKFIADALSEFSPAEQAEFGALFKEIADQAGTPPVNVRKGEHPIRPELRRFARSMGLLKLDVPEAGLSLREYEVLRMIKSAPGDLSAAGISQVTGLKQSNLSAMLDNLQKRNLVQRQNDGDDNRASVISLTRLGISELKRYEQAIVRELKSLLVGVSERNLRRLVNLFGRFHPHPKSQIMPTDNLVFLELKSDYELRLARAVFVADAVERGQHYYLPESIFASNNRTFGAYLDNRICAVCELVKDTKGYRALNAWAASALSMENKARFREKVSQTIAQDKAKMLTPLERVAALS